MNWMSHDVHDRGDGKKGRMNLTVSFFSKWKEGQWLSFDFSQDVAILGN